MIKGKVVGRIIASRKHENLQGKAFFVIEPGQIVAVDTVGAGVGDEVLVVTGSNAKYACDLKKMPIDAAIVGIIDQES